MKKLSDFELLQAYGRDRSEDAFREVVARNLDGVYSAAWRQLGRLDHAQEATQNAFIDLAAKAGRLPRGTVVAGWLHRAVHYAGLKIQRSEARRKRREEEASRMETEVPGRSNPEFDEAAIAQVDAALAELGSADRAAIILRFLQQKSFREVGHALGASEEAAKKRVSRALEKLRDLLAQRGVTVPSAAVAAGLSQLPMASAPPDWAAQLVSTAMSATPPAGSLSALASWWKWPTQSTAAAIVEALLLVGLVGGWWALRSPRGDSATTPSPPALRITTASVMVDDQDKALAFYTGVLGFRVKMDFPAGGGRWLTVVSPDEPEGLQLLLEPMGFPAARTYQGALRQAGLPALRLRVSNLEHEYSRLNRRGVRFAQEPRKTRFGLGAILDDTCGNFIELTQSNDSDDPAALPTMALRWVNLPVDDQERALRFYVDELGLALRADLNSGDHRQLAVGARGDEDRAELLLERNVFPPTRAFQQALFEAGIPYTQFGVADCRAAYEHMKSRGVRFKGPPTAMGPVVTAVFADTCGNWLQMVQP